MAIMKCREEEKGMGEKGKPIEVIQVMRLAGAMLVVLFHANLIGDRGYFGVDIFSVISGYIIMYSTEKVSSQKNFLLKRMIRILPLYWLMTILNYGIISVLPQLSIMSEAKPEYLIKSMLFIPFVNGKGYNTPILGLGWTLNYEVMFYLVFFCAVHISHKWRGFLAASMLWGMAIAGMGVEFPNLLLNYYTDSFLLEFSWGIFAFYIIRALEIYGKNSKVKAGCFLAGLFCFIAMFFDSPESQVPRCFRLGIPAFFFFCTMMVAGNGIHFNKKAVALGGMTYSLYLIEYFTTAAYKAVVPQGNMAVQIFAFVPCLALTVGCAYVSYQVVEQRGGKYLRKVLKLEGR